MQHISFKAQGLKPGKNLGFNGKDVDNDDINSHIYKYTIPTLNVMMKTIKFKTPQYLREFSSSPSPYQ